jgi:uncharacterized protein YbjT (DUF2867 family)
MRRVLLFGGSGNLGKEICKEVKRQGYILTAVVRNTTKANDLAGIADQCIIADVSNPDELKNRCGNFDIVISSLGKSVSPNDKSKPSFHDVDFVVNGNILEEAIKSGIRKFVYVSAFNAEKYLHLEYFKAHHAFSERLKQSGLDYSLKPPALFSAFG